MKPKLLIYLPLEPYEERYTFQLKQWNEDHFKKRKINFVTIKGKTLFNDQEIHTGQVLDAHGRSYYALTQIAQLVAFLELRNNLLEDTEIIVFSEDMFAPGYEALPYIRHQIKNSHNLKFYTRCLAQTIDPDDFTFGWRNWMRHYELMCSETLDGLFVASTEMAVHLEMCMVDKCPLYVTGLPFDMHEVRKRAGPIPEYINRPNRVIYASRLDREKQPHFFLDLVQSLSNHKKLEFVIASGSKELRSNDPTVLPRIKELIENGWLTVHTGLKKNEYYDLLKNSKVQFNCARQDWVSNTLNEASALETPSLCPAFRSFPEALFNRKEFLYAPWCLDEARAKLLQLLVTVFMNSKEVRRVAEYQTKTLSRTTDILLGKKRNPYLYKGFYR